MQQDPFLGVLETLNRANVRYLVIAGRACIFYGATEFTRDLDIWVEPILKNLSRVCQAMSQLDARLRFLPFLKLKYLSRGHAVHYMIRDFGASEISVDTPYMLWYASGMRNQKSAVRGKGVQNERYGTVQTVAWDSETMVRERGAIYQGS